MGPVLLLCVLMGFVCAQVQFLGVQADIALSTSSASTLAPPQTAGDLIVVFAMPHAPVPVTVSCVWPRGALTRFL